MDNWTSKDGKSVSHYYLASITSWENYKYARKGAAHDRERGLMPIFHTHKADEECTETCQPAPDPDAPARFAQIVMR